jgi:hypothetical protein
MLTGISAGLLTGISVTWLWHERIQTDFQTGIIPRLRQQQSILLATAATQLESNRHRGPSPASNTGIREPVSELLSEPDGSWWGRVNEEWERMRWSGWNGGVRSVANWLLGPGCEGPLRLRQDVREERVGVDGEDVWVQVESVGNGSGGEVGLWDQFCTSLVAYPVSPKPRS